MSRPEFATEPSMEEILASIRKMISDEPVGMPPVPDPFPPNPAVAGAVRGMGADRWDGRPGPQTNVPERPSPNYNRLSEALKSASTPSFEPTRTLEEEIAEMLGKASAGAEEFSAPSSPVTPFGGRETQGFAAGTHEFGRPLDMPAAPNPARASRVYAEPEPASFAMDETNLAFEEQPSAISEEAVSDNDSATQTSEIDGALDDIEASVEIKTVEPFPAEPGEQMRSAQAAKPKPSPQSVPSTEAFASRAQKQKLETENGGGPRAEAPTSRATPASSGSNGATVSPIRPRPAAVERAPSGSKAAATPAGSSAQPATTVKKDGSAASRVAGVAARVQSQVKNPAKKNGAPSEALVDAMVDLVQKDPGSMSVFTSGSDFIHGVGHPQHDPDSPVHKLDGAAAELLRPMLRQWLSDNMPRIVEEALRSELSSTGSSDKYSSGK